MKRAGREDVIDVAVSTTLIWQVSMRADELSQYQSDIAGRTPLDGRARSRSPEPRRSASTLKQPDSPHVQGNLNAFNTQSGTLFVTTEDVVHALELSTEVTPQLSLAGEKEQLFRGEHAELLLSSERYFRSATRKSGCFPHFVGQSLDDRVRRQDIGGGPDYPKCTSIWLYFCVPTGILTASEFWYSGKFDASLTLLNCRPYQSNKEQSFLLSFHFHARGAINHLLHEMARGRVQKDFWCDPRYHRSASIVGLPVHRDFLLEQLAKTDDDGNKMLELWDESHLEVMVAISSNHFEVSRWTLENVAHFIADVELSEIVEEWWSNLHSELLFRTGHVLYHVGLHNFKTHLLRGAEYCSASDKTMWKRRTGERNPTESIEQLRIWYKLQSDRKHFIPFSVREDGYFLYKVCEMTEEEQWIALQVRTLLGREPSEPFGPETDVSSEDYEHEMPLLCDEED